MPGDRAGEHGGPDEVGPVVPAGRVDPAGQVALGPEQPDLPAADDRELGRGGGQTHRLVEPVEGQVQPALVCTENEDLAGLVSGHENGHAQLGEQAGEVGRVLEPDGGQGWVGGWEVGHAGPQAQVVSWIGPFYRPR